MFGIQGSSREEYWGFGSQEVFREGEGCLGVRGVEADKERRSFRSQGASNRFSEV